jgi:uncharacterized protein with GYD domain
MAKYLWKVSYNTEGIRGVMKEGATGRHAFIEKMTSDLDGELEAFYFAFGDTDAFVIADLPDDETAAAVALAVAAAGVASIETVKLLTAEQVDRARKVTVAYRAPAA